MVPFTFSSCLSRLRPELVTCFTGGGGVLTEILSYPKVIGLGWTSQFSCKGNPSVTDGYLGRCFTKWLYRSVFLHNTPTMNMETYPLGKQEIKSIRLRGRAGEGGEK